MSNLLQRMYNIVHFYWAVSPVLNLLIQALLIFKQFLQGFKGEEDIFFNQTSKQLIFIEQPFGVEATTGFLCWYRMLLLLGLVFISGKITISFILLLKLFCSFKGAFHLHRNKFPLRVTGLHLTRSLKIAGHRGLSIKEYSDNWISCWTRTFAISTLSFTIDCLDDFLLKINDSLTFKKAAPLRVLARFSQWQWFQSRAVWILRHFTIEWNTL